MRTLQGWLRRYGRPLAHYTDKASIFRKAGPQPLAEQLRGDALCTQFGRALNELGIEWIAAHSPQAKGRIERLFETLQDRLVKQMRLAGIDSIAGANHFLEMRFLPEWEQRFTVAARNPRNVHRRLGPEQHLEEILSVRVARKVAQDHTVSWDGNRWGVAAGRSLCGASWSCGGDRTAVGRKPLAALPRPLSAPARLPRTGAAVRKSFRPTASRTCGTNTKTPKQNQTQIPCTCKPPLEKTMEADISIWQKPGHFYFALTHEYRHVPHRGKHFSFAAAH